MSRLTSVIAFFVIAIAGMTIAYFMIERHNETQNRLPILNPSDLNPDLVDESKRGVTTDHTIGDFKFVDQNGNEVGPSNFKDKIYVTDFFFTTCPSICPKMTRQMERIQETFKDKPDFRILSHTVQPEVDSVPVLAKYAEEHGAIPGFWCLVTGNKKDIYEMARQHYFAATSEGDGGPNDFVHTENFVLIDKEKRIRGFYDGTSTEDVDRLIDDVHTLYKEYETK